ncbi:DUF4249 domain-containing protein [Dysgonomonas sp. OttesenSCG-928-M03]|nr:DUF4249 domain-containing protein [Dysgonomonas sp. OttesenSCG-928-M03]
MKSLLILFLSFIFFSSCVYERVIDIGDIPIAPHLVLNSLVQAGNDTSYFYLTESRAIYGDTTTVWDRDKSGFTMIRNADFNLNINGNTHHVEFSHADSAYVFIGKLHGGDDVSIQISQNKRNINTKGILPSVPEVLSVDTARFQRIESGNLRKYIMFKIKIKDRPGSKDYYRLMINGVYYYQWNNEYNYYNSNSFYTDDPILKNGYTGTSGNSDIGLASSVYNYYSVFRDVGFADQEYTLSFYVDDFDEESGNNYSNGREYLYVGMQSISEDLYKYYSSLQRNRQLAWNNISEPIMIHTNIDGGLGILGTCNEVKLFEYKTSKK